MKKLLVFFLCIGATMIAAAQKPTKQNIHITANSKNITSGKPLYFVDGFETGEECMVLDPSNIESITVLKNKTATDLYGERAINGVILIKTKSGTSFNYITDFVNKTDGLNSSITKVELNGVPVTNMQKLLIDKSSLVSTMISSDIKLDKDCKPIFNDTLLITTRFAGN